MSKVEALNLSHTQVSKLAAASYALPALPILILMSTSNVLSGVYATYHGLSLASISMVMLIAGLFDAVTDPTIGYLSDRYHARTGSRRLFIVMGAVLLIPCAWFLLNPSEGVTVIYFLTWYLLFYLAITLFQIPHITWGGEISPVGEEKNKVYGYRNYASYAGMILFSLIPILFSSDGTKVTPETMRMLVIVAAVLLLPTVFMMFRYVPVGKKYTETIGAQENPLRAIRSLAHNKSLIIFLVGSAMYGIGSAAYVGLKFMVIGAYLGLGDYYAYLLLFHLVVATLAVKPAIGLITLIGKVKALTIAYVLSVIAYASVSLVLLNGLYSLHLLVFLNFVLAFASAINNISAYSLLSDISDYSTLKTGVDRSAMCFSLQSLASKTTLATGISLSIGFSGYLGFDPAAKVQSAHVYWGLALSMSIIPVLLTMIAAFCMSRVAITASRHRIIRKRLDDRSTKGESTSLYKRSEAY